MKLMNKVNIKLKKGNTIYLNKMNQFSYVYVNFIHNIFYFVQNIIENQNWFQAVTQDGHTAEV